MIDTLKIKIFADGAKLEDFKALRANQRIAGFTTNPTLMRNAGVEDYTAFAHQAIVVVDGKPISFEVFADDLEAMEEQALEIASWGENVYVKIPVTNTKGESTAPIIRSLSKEGVCLNITAVFTMEQVREVEENLAPGVPSIISLFAGRIADSGKNPRALVEEAVELTKLRDEVEILWASTRELYNLVEADSAGCQIITVPSGLLAKIDLLGKDLEEFSLETVQMFHKDALAAAYTIKTKERI
ncbi:MAG: Transaldolase [Chlamydiia bacterium]|nr:Transaldolase [Chlamydiia bacterium]MCH9616412.1 Transaldolase [Chlamydiia bacterium]MCH9629602.1 Transaldolase [Chlamydiia bacterium]